MAAAPTVFPLAISTHGEMCSGMQSFQEWLTLRYKGQIIKEGTRDDGVAPETLSARFRTTFRLNMIFAMANGLAHAQIKKSQFRAEIAWPQDEGQRQNGRAMGSGGAGEVGP